MGAEQGVVVALALRHRANLFALQHKRATAIAIDATGRGGTVTVLKCDATLEHVIVVDIVTRGRVGWLQFQRGAEFADEELCVLQFIASGAAPAQDEFVNGHAGSLAGRVVSA